MFFKSDQGNIFYRVIGTGNPVVILHGFPLDHRVMTGCLEPLFRKHPGLKRIYIDLPGMGKSAGVKGLQSSQDIYRLTARLISLLVGTKPFALIGYSFGGYLAQHLAARMPERIIGLALIAPVVIANPRRRSVEKQIPLVSGYTPRYFKTLDEKDIFLELAVRTRTVWQKMRRHILSGVAKANKPVTDKIFSEAYALPHHNLIWERKVRTPALVITGHKDTVVGSKDVKKIRKNFTKAKYVTIDNAGHYLMLEQPETFSMLIKEWLIKI